MAKKFAGKRHLEDIKKTVLQNGWPWDQRKYDDGSDWLSFGFVHQSRRYNVVYCTFNGKFMVRRADGKGKLYTEKDGHMDGTAWYDAPLDLIYLPLQEAAA